MSGGRSIAGLYGCIGSLLCLALAAASTAPAAGRSAPLPRDRPTGYQPDHFTNEAAPVSRGFVEAELASVLPTRVPQAPPVADVVRPAPPRSPEPEIRSGPAAPGAVVKGIRCVNGRQTEDPLAPACVDGFVGDNGGATWRGVSGDEVRIVLRVAGGGHEPDPSIALVRRVPTNSYLDLDDPLGPEAPLGAHTLRALTEYFNRRFQTYGRRVSITVFYDNAIVASFPDQSRALAAELDVLRRPYAVLYGHYGSGVGDDHHLAELASRDITVMDAKTLTRALTAAHQDLLWSLRPSVEHHAQLLSSYVCQKVLGHAVALSGNPVETGTPRRLALVRPGDPRLSKEATLAALVRTQVEACGGRFVDELVFPKEFGACGVSPTSTVVYATPAHDAAVADQVARLRSRGVTTLVWPSCLDTRVARAVTAIGWRPEWILSGDGTFDRSSAPAFGVFSELLHRRAVMVTPRPYERPVRSTICAQAVREVAPEVVDFHELYHGCRAYALLRQLFTAVQVAGPNLRPDEVAAGFARSPMISSADPEVPTCLYAPGEYSCIKDAQVQWWDAGPRSETPLLLGTAELPGPGCWRSIEGGRRYLPGHWPAGNIDAQITWGEPCSSAFSE